MPVVGSMQAPRERAWAPLFARSLGAIFLRYFFALFLGAVVAELLEIGPQVGDVLVVLDADERHAGTRHLLHRGVDVFRERCLVPRDAGFLVGLGIVVALEGPGFAAVDAVERRS